ncbi:MAG: adenosylmethionine--8-amino-7-oxononanoate transaminase [Campylobacter sputorum]|uniref:adenosylmethionine--8-amino-7-oxononanoate transaminase n=1 Tax=Campylobacter sputorum TaxID=206 RepID=UPI000B77E19B|nr:adenosylmethionine--8-amino-7-oxononanoate transaminase [Campylobacter sputorum]ASM38253.1 bifunctional 7,8-diaminopelargonic acid synthase / dethiobiotin synthetase [Campylobacter sputorum bv. paraureolyticus LMG 11764]MDY6120099.1 adenosylmethionine--8-amino-7-oxononanoate transaminase [Campylobacter sputorum]
MKKSYFITATDTDVGKTFVTTLLLAKLVSLGIKTKAIKPIETGFESSGEIPQTSDIASYMSVDKNSCFMPAYTFKYPASPDFAANLEKRSIDINKVYDYCQQHMQNSDITLIEGAGGILVPLNKEQNFSHLIKMLEISVILVVENKLGALNNAILNIEFCQNNGIDIACIVMNKTNLNDKIALSNINFIKEKYETPVIIVKKYQNNYFKNIIKDVDFSEFLNNLNIQKDEYKFDSKFDKNHLWHPYISMLEPLKTYFVNYAYDKYIFTNQGKLIDAMSSWWAVWYGYNKENINKAAISQINKFSHVMFGGITHEPAINLGKKLIEILPSSLEHIFYSDSGSVSVEVAIKMALQYQHNKNPKKTKILTPFGGYHGDTFGAMSICDPINGMHSLFKNTLAKQIFFEKPKCAYDEQFKESFLDDLKIKLKEHKDEIAAIILEPIVQGAGGMWFYNKEYLKFIRDICDKEDIVLIFDEIATGFGRTGEMFAMDLAKVTPDIVCLGKAITAGFTSFGVTIANKKIAHGVSENNLPFMHGPTFMANAMACSVALESINTLLNSNWKENVRNISIWLKNSLEKCKEFDIVKDVRVLGAIGVVELKTDVNMERIQEFFVKEGVWLRPFGKLIYTMPHFNFDKNDIEKISNAIYKCIKEGAYL